MRRAAVPLARMRESAAILRLLTKVRACLLLAPVVRTRAETFRQATFAAVATAAADALDGSSGAPCDGDAPGCGDARCGADLPAWAPAAGEGDVPPVAPAEAAPGDCAVVVVGVGPRDEAVVALVAVDPPQAPSTSAHAASSASANNRTIRGALEGVRARHPIIGLARPAR